jgi:hypothetical protein
MDLRVSIGDGPLGPLGAPVCVFVCGGGGGGGTETHNARPAARGEETGEEGGGSLKVSW